MNKTTVKNILLILMVLSIATMTACNLATSAQEGSTVEVVLGGIGGAGRKLSFGNNATWVAINVVNSSGVQKGSGSFTSKTNNVWKGSIHVSESGTMRFIATAGVDTGKVDWLGSITLVMGTASQLTIAVDVPTVDGSGYGPAGGKVFYDKGSYSAGWRYLEAAAPSDQSAVSVWSNMNTTLIGPTAQGIAIGTGKANTEAIVGQTGFTSGAAKVCKDYTGGGYTDWFLPSLDELNAMYGKSGTIGSFASAYYWSSSESNDSAAWAQYFGGGLQGSRAKANGYYVRAVRGF